MFPTIPIVSQLEFHPTRKWRFDFSFEEAFLAIEIQGFGPGHNSYEGMKKDYEKHNAAIELGWSLIYLISDDLESASIQRTCKFIANLRTERLKNDNLITALKELNNGRRATNNSLQVDERRGHWKVQLDEARRKFLKGPDQ